MPRHSELDHVIFLPLYRRIHVDSRILPGHAIGSKNNFYNKNKGLYQQKVSLLVLETLLTEVFLLDVILRPNLMSPFSDLDRVIFYLFITGFLLYLEYL